jgi:hypothetical protein
MNSSVRHLMSPKSLPNKKTVLYSRDIKDRISRAALPLFTERLVLDENTFYGRAEADIHLPEIWCVCTLFFLFCKRTALFAGAVDKY